MLSALVAGLLPAKWIPTHVFSFVLAALHELVVGLFMGFVIRMAFQVVSLAGEIWANQGHFTRDMAFDPMSGTSASAVERLLYNFAIVVFLGMGLHYQVLGDFVKSYDFAPLGVWVPSQGAINALIAQSSQIFTVAVQMAAPIVAVNFIINMTFAVLGKAAPQVNVFLISFSVIIAAALTLFAMTVDVMGYSVAKMLGDSAKNLLYWMTLP